MPVLLVVVLMVEMVEMVEMVDGAVILYCGWSGSDNYSQSKEDAALGVVGGVNGSGGSGGGSVVGGAATNAIGFAPENLNGATYTYTEITN